MRAFIGIFLPKEIQYDFKSYKQQLRKQKQNLLFIPAPDIHLNLKYLGPKVKEETIDDLRNIIPNVLRDHKPFDIQIGRVQLGLSYSKFPKVLNIMLSQNSELEKLVVDIEHSLGGGRFKDIYAPKKDYIPHIAIGNLHGNIHRKKIFEVKDAINRATWEGVGKKIPVNAVKIVHTESTKDGYIYRELGEFNLTGK